MFRRGSAAIAKAWALQIATAAVATAQVNLSLNRAGSGARAAGMGDAFVAVCDDGTAASWNPAGLAQLRQPELSFVYGVSDRNFHMSGLRSSDNTVAYSNWQSPFSYASPEFASAALPFSVLNKPVTLQGGWHRLYKLSGQFAGRIDGFALNGPPERVSMVSLDSQVHGNIDLFTVDGAVKLTSRVAVGAGVNFWKGDWTERSATAEAPSPEAPGAFFVGTSEHEIRGHNLALGLLLTYPSWNAGFVYYSPFWASYPVEAESRSTARPPATLHMPNGRFRLPRSIGLGVARRWPSRWTAALSVNHDQWTDALVDGIPGVQGAVNFFDEAPPQFSTTRDTVSLNVGVEHILVREGSVVPVRLGAGWEPQGPMDPITRDPLGYRLLSVGAGYNTNHFKFDAAVQLRWTGFRASQVLTVRTATTGRLVTDALGVAENREWRIKLSVIYRLPEKNKLVGVARKIFG
jgi:long-chain fatty acid transport protein